MKKVLSVLLAVLLVLSMAPVSLAATTEANNAANHLYELGLFAGTGAKPDGSPIFSLDNMPDRSQGITMLVALLGKSEEAKSGTWYTPFTDVPAWAKPAVGYAYTNKLTAGASPTKFGHGQPLTASQYLTFVLTALGYEQGSGKDFTWRNPFALSDKLGITGGRYTASSRFTRGDVAIVSNNALNAKMKNSTKTLLDALIESGAVKDPNPSPDPDPSPDPGTPTPAPSNDTAQKLAQYINANGQTDDSGRKAVASQVTDQFFSSITYDQTKNQLYFSGVYLDKDNTGGTATTIIYDIATKTFLNPVVFLFAASNEEYSMTANISPDTYLPTTTLTFTKYEGSASIDPSAFQELANNTTRLAVASWAEHLSGIGFDLRDLGFAAFVNALNPGTSTPTPTPTSKPTPTTHPTPTTQPTPGIPAGNKGRQLAQYITANGIADSSGEKYLDFSQQENGNTVTSHISYDVESDSLWFFGMYESVEDFTTCVLLEYSLEKNAFDSFTYFAYEDGNSLEFEMSAHLNPAVYTKNTTLSFKQLSGPNLLTPAKANQLANKTTLLSVMAWALQLQKIGFSIADVGFTSFLASL